MTWETNPKSAHAPSMHENESKRKTETTPPHYCAPLLILLTE